MKIYTYQHQSDYNEIFKDSQNQIWSYYQTKMLPNHLPILGQISTKETSTFLTHEEKQLFIAPSQKKPFQQTVGYLLCADESGQEYIVEIKKNRIGLVYFLFIGAILIILGGMFTLNSLHRLKLDSNAIAYQMPDGLKNENPNSIMIPGYEALMMNEGNVLPISLLNPEGNPCYFKYTLFLKDSNEVIYESELVKPGMAIVPVTLNQNLEPGTYTLIIQVSTASLDNPEQEMNGGIVETTLTVK